MNRRRRGFTLPELLVYMVVLLVFVTGIYSAFTLSLRCFHTAQARSDSMQAGQQAINFINRMVATGASSTINTATAGALLFLSAQPTGTDKVTFVSDSNGNLMWYKWVCIYLDTSTGVLKESEQNLGTATSTIPTTPPTVAAMRVLPSRVVARNITAFTFPTTSSYSITANASASIAAKSDLDKQLGVIITAQLITRN